MNINIGPNVRQWLCKASYAARQDKTDCIAVMYINKHLGYLFIEIMCKVDIGKCQTVLNYELNITYFKLTSLNVHKNDSIGSIQSEDRV